MKKIILSSTLILAIMLSFGADREYVQKMEKNIKELYSAGSGSAFIALAGSFGQIADTEKDEWLPCYYAAFAYINYAFSGDDPSAIDQYLDQAQQWLDRAGKISPENAEIAVLQGWLYQGRIMADPSGRGMTFSQKAGASFGKAQKLEPENPRIYFLTGQNILYTPEQYGGGKAAACPYFLKAKEKYETFRPASSIDPDWGKEYNNKQANNCEL